MKLVVHIGAEKCGSTSIQSFFQEKRESLMESGIISPSEIGRKTGPLNHAYLVLASRGPMPEPDDLENNITKANTLGFKTINSLVNNSLERARSAGARVCFITSEHFSSRLRSREEISNLKYILSQYWSDISIVAYVRDQVAWYKSSYSTAVRCGQTRQFSRWLERVLHGKSASWLILYNDWASVFGEKNVNFHGVRSLMQNDKTIYQSVLEECGITQSIISALGRETSDKNTSPDSKTLEIIRHINHYEKWMLPNGEINLRRSELIEKILGYKDKLKFRSSDMSEEHERIIEKHINENKELVRIFPALKHDLTVARPSKYLLRMPFIAKRRFVKQLLYDLPQNPNLFNNEEPSLV